MTHHAPAKSFKRKPALLVIAVMALCALVSISAWATTTEVIHYSYDDASQLIRTLYADGSKVEHAYDNMGNHLVKTTTAAGSTPDNDAPNTPSQPSPAAAATNVDRATLSFSWTGGSVTSNKDLLLSWLIIPSNPFDNARQIK